jgi:hypothetical protein
LSGDVLDFVLTVARERSVVRCLDLPVGNSASEGAITVAHANNGIQ